NFMGQLNKVNKVQEIRSWQLQYIVMAEDQHLKNISNYTNECSIYHFVCNRCM
ncbi:hypothetical protein MKX01_029534, partial [Papaver californicum]